MTLSYQFGVGGYGLAGLGEYAGEAGSVRTDPGVVGSPPGGGRGGGD